MGNASKTRPKMPLSQRAKQFLPFDAVTGLQQALRKKEAEMGQIEDFGGLDEVDFDNLEPEDLEKLSAEEFDDQ